MDSGLPCGKSRLDSVVGAPEKKSELLHPGLLAPALTSWIAVSVAAVVCNHHGNGIATKPLMRSTLPQPWRQPFAHDHRNDRQPALYSFPGSICECRCRP